MDRTLEEWITEAVPSSQRHLIHAALFPGRRTRPVLFMALLQWPKGKPLTGVYRSTAICLELLHRASIIVDDIVDRDLTRRGQPTLHVSYGVERVVIISHLLCAEAIQQAECLPNKLRTEILNAYKEMAIGELADVDKNSWVSDPLRTYEDLVLRKTEALFCATLFAAAVLDGHLSISAILARDLGQWFGRVYQLANDFYDDLEAPVESRGQQTVSALNLSLATAHLLASDPQWCQLISNSVDELSESLLRRLTFDRRRPEIVEACHSNVEYARKHLSQLCQKAPIPWGSVLREMGSWVSTYQCWDHNDLIGGAYVE